MGILKLIDVNKTYKGGTTAITDINFTVHEGEFISIIGPSGAGKSTILRSINRLIDITSGQIIFDNTDMGSLNKKELRKTRRKIGMIFQHYNLVSRLSVIENVLHGRLGYKSAVKGILGIYKEEEKEMAFEFLEKMGLKEQAYKRCDELSGGQKQRVGIARALIQNPKMLLCDEPIASLDPGSSKIIMDHLKEINQNLNITCILNLHHLETAKKYSDKIIGVNSGKIVFQGTPEELTEEKIHDIYGTCSENIIAC